MLNKLERDEDSMESEEAIEQDLVNSLPQELDIKVNYRDAVRPISLFALVGELYLRRLPHRNSVSL